MEHDPHRFSSLEKEQSSDGIFSSRMLEPEVHARFYEENRQSAPHFSGEVNAVL
ncbi:hypothetical protein [Methanofollis sp. W23]|uniref:hypothetical protein n=1 Tax=Methanofollis sp. W23 TaxID=2817849 RepID=UPI001AE31A35|nr:hypothetical protein [Methanofollis sp. W23]